jgi:hypothetical protein
MSTFRWSTATRRIFAVSAVVCVTPIAMQVFLDEAFGPLGSIHATAPASVFRVATVTSVPGAEPQVNRRARQEIGSAGAMDISRLLPFALASLDAQFDRRTLANDVTGFETYERVADWRQVLRRSPRARGKIYLTALSGFHGAAYRDSATRHVIIALRGADAVPTLDLSVYGGMHALAPYAAGALRDPQALRAIQHDAALAFTSAIRRQFPDHRVSLTGHGVGAVLARHTAARLDIAAVTFGAAPAHVAASRSGSYAALLQQAQIARASDRASVLRLEQVAAEMIVALPAPIAERSYIADGAN